MCWRASLAGLLLAAGLAGAACSAPLPIPAFFAPPASRGAQLSPSGRYLALIESRPGGDVVSVLDLSTRDRSVALSAKSDKLVDWVRWKGDGRLLAGLSPVSDPARLDGDDRDDADPSSPSEILTALDRDGGRAVLLDPGAVGAHDLAARIADPLSRDPAHVLLAAKDAKGGTGLWKVDVQSGAAEFVGEGRPTGDDQLPAGTMVVRYDHRAKAADADFDILGPAPGAERAYVALQPRDAADGDVATVRIYDFARKTLSDPLWPALKYDVSDVVYHAGDKGLAGVCFTADAYLCQFKDPGLEADYRLIQKTLGDSRSITPLSMSEDGHVWLLGVSGPTEPGAYYVFDRKTKRLERAVDRHPGLPASRLGTMVRFVYKARDGTMIPGYVTRPPGARAGEPLPLIVMPHGGPEARDSLTFDIWDQVFATRGYMVFQPNFRGSSGYGRAFVEAGYGQWGGRMNDDITDGVRALIADGQADPKRICIFGASFGGYAALIGGAEHADLYKCVASFAGVSDLRALVQWEHSTKGHRARWRYAERSIGDPVKDAGKLEAASPITYAPRYRPPVLLIHGARDQSVPLIQSQMMARALKHAGRAARLIVYDGEGHSDWSPADEQSALSQLVAFFERHIAPSSPTVRSAKSAGPA